MLFGKKPQVEENKEAPVQEVTSLRQKGLPNEDIITYLKKKGYTLAQIRDAITQVDIKSTAMGGQELPEPPEVPGIETPAKVEDKPVIEAPSLEDKPIELPKEENAGGLVDIKKVERILEQMLSEKWTDVEGKYSGLDKWKADVNAKITLIESKMDDITKRIENVDKMLLGKLDEYDKTMEDVGTSVQSLEKVMKNIVPSLSEGINELRSMSSKHKTKKK